MQQIFNFPTALVIRGPDYLRVRFWARPGDALELDSVTKYYGADADVILLVSGPPGTPTVPEFPTGTQLFDGPGIEFVFMGQYLAEVDEEGLHVTVDDGQIDVMRGNGLPYDREALANAETLSVMGDVSFDDHPPHGPPLVP